MSKNSQLTDKLYRCLLIALGAASLLGVGGGVEKIRNVDYYCVSLLIETDHSQTAYIRRDFKINKEAVAKILDRRSPVPMQATTYTVQGQVFTAHMKLGEGSNHAFLGLAANGKRVVIKKIRAMRNQALQEYEALITLFYLSKGIEVPAILAYDRRQGVIVKEYEEGLTSIEVDENIAVLAGNKLASLDFSKALHNHRNILRAIHPGFREWLKKFHPESLPRLDEWPNIVDFGDFIKDANFVFSVEKGRWVLIDP